jgi:hypothetical protein
MRAGWLARHACGCGHWSDMHVAAPCCCSLLLPLWKGCCAVKVIVTPLVLVVMVLHAVVMQSLTLTGHTQLPQSASAMLNSPSSQAGHILWAFIVLHWLRKACMQADPAVLFCCLQQRVRFCDGHNTLQPWCTAARALYRAVSTLALGLYLAASSKFSTRSGTSVQPDRTQSCADTPRLS